jgi:hypothetical protein
MFLYMAVLLLESYREETVTGLHGETRETGPMGTQCIPGKDGVLILFENGVPAESLGNDGDMYLDRAGSELFRPDSEGWQYPLPFIGVTNQFQVYWFATTSANIFVLRLESLDGTPLVPPMTDLIFKTSQYYHHVDANFYHIENFTKNYFYENDKKNHVFIHVSLDNGQLFLRRGE